MKFNMGCGRRKVAGYINVDSTPACEPDEVWDLEATPWPWPDNCAEEIRFIHSLEHMGQDPKVFLAIMQETYRIAAPDSQVIVHVPHPRHDHFISDPTHVRPITAGTFHLFDREANQHVLDNDGANTPLAVYTGVDFKVESMRMKLDEPYWGQYGRGELSEADANLLIRTQFNIVREIQFVLRVRKPA
jgi:hypothetical protein